MTASGHRPLVMESPNKRLLELPQGRRMHEAVIDPVQMDNVWRSRNDPAIDTVRQKSRREQPWRALLVPPHRQSIEIRGGH